MIKPIKVASFFIFPIIIFLLNEIFMMLGTYDAILWLDIPMHIIGGIAVGYTYFLTLNYLQKEKYFKLNSFARILFIISLVALTAVFWEFYEFGMDFFFLTHYQPSNADTMKDLFMGLLGGAFISLLMENIHN